MFKIKDCQQVIEKVERQLEGWQASVCVKGRAASVCVVCDLGNPHLLSLSLQASYGDQKEIGRVNAGVLLERFGVRGQ